MLETILAALIVWTNQSPETLRPWAKAMADVCTTHEECILLASQAFVETRFQPWVMDQRCNDSAWRLAQHGWVRQSCDSGKSYGIWQIMDERMRGASPEEQAAKAISLMRWNPKLWTTWKQARSHAAWWLKLSATPE